MCFSYLKVSVLAFDVVHLVFVFVKEHEFVNQVLKVGHFLVLIYLSHLTHLTLHGVLLELVEHLVGMGHCVLLGDHL